MKRNVWSLQRFIQKRARKRLERIERVFLVNLCIYSYLGYIFFRKFKFMLLFAHFVEDNNLFRLNPMRWRGRQEIGL